MLVLALKDFDTILFRDVQVHLIYYTSIKLVVSTMKHVFLKVQGKWTKQKLEQKAWKGNICNWHRYISATYPTKLNNPSYLNVIYLQMHSAKPNRNQTATLRRQQNNANSNLAQTVEQHTSTVTSHQTCLSPPRHHHHPQHHKWK